MKESPIFSRTYDLLRWIIPATLKFPRQQRFVLAAEIQRVSLDFQARLVEAIHLSHPSQVLAKADVELARLRINLRLCRDMELFNGNQYEHAARLVDEVGRLLGAWRKAHGGKISGSI